MHVADPRPMPRTTSRRTQRERSEATIVELIDAARRLFATAGYAGTSLDDVVREAGMTKGALYHHFDGKAALFRAVFEREQERIGDRIRHEYLKYDDPVDAFYAGCEAFLRASLDSGMQRITLVDAPVVLGWETVRSITATGTYAMVELALQRAMDMGAIPARPMQPLATLLFGAICEAAISVARAGDDSMSLETTLGEVRQLIESLR